MTGLYVRIMRDGHAQNLEIEELTDDELRDFFSKQPCENWAVTLAGWIRDNVEE